MAELWASKVVLICWYLQYTPNFCPFLAPLRYTDHCTKVSWRFDQNWPSYRPPKWCPICWYLQYTPNFCPFLAPLRYTDHCAKVSWRFDQNWPSYRPSKCCLIWWCLRYTPIFCPSKKNPQIQYGAIIMILFWKNFSHIFATGGPCFKTKSE